MFSEIEIVSEKGKYFADLALNAGRKMQNETTGYIHYHYHTQDESNHPTLPVYENLLFALSLLSSRQVENAIEAKNLIDKLLYFQNLYPGEFLGHFPVYLHEYPSCCDKYQGAYLLAPFYWIIKKFQGVLGQGLNKRLLQAVTLLLDYCMKLLQQPHLPYVIDLRISASMVAFGTLFQNPSLQSEGQGRLESIEKNFFPIEWGMPHQIADILVALQMVYPSIKHSPWSIFWDYLGKTWDLRTLSYAGPGIREYQWRGEPKAMLYDLYLGSFSGAYSKRALILSPYHLQAVLIQPVEDNLEQPMVGSGCREVIGGNHWTAFFNESSIFSFVEKKDGVPGHQEKGFSPLKIIWGNAENTHTLFCQGGSFRTVCKDFIRSDAIGLTFTLDGPLELIDRESQREICFYLDLGSQGHLYVNDAPANTFLFGDSVKIALAGSELHFNFQLSEGSGMWIGHFMPGNRPSQLAVKGDARFNAYDSQIILRTIRKEGACAIKVCIERRPTP